MVPEFKCRHHINSEMKPEFKCMYNIAIQKQEYYSILSFFLYYNTGLYISYINDFVAAHQLAVFWFSFPTTINSNFNYLLQYPNIGVLLLIFRYYSEAFTN